jgi:hypothetical protein
LLILALRLAPEDTRIDSRVEDVSALISLASVGEEKIVFLLLFSKD